MLVKIQLKILRFAQNYTDVTVKMTDDFELSK